VRLSQPWRRAAVRFDEEILVSCAGLVPVMQLAEDSGLHELVAGTVRISDPPIPSTGVNPAGKISSIVAGMAAGADSIEDLGVLRHGGMPELFGEVYAPSTLGSFLRAFSWGHALQLAAAARDWLVRLAGCTPVLAGAGQMAYVDIDSLLRRVYGHKKQGARFGHAKVGGYPVLLRGLSPLVATICTPLAAPVVAAARLRGGGASSVKGAASLLAEALSVARAAGATGPILVRADSAFYAGKVVCAARRAGAMVSITVGHSPARQRAISSISDSAWRPVHYPQAVVDPDTGQLISDAEVAETGYTAFADTRHEYTGRLVVRRVRDQNSQDRLFPVWRYHAFFTDTALSTVDADLTHRQHAVVETVFADLIDGRLAHLTSVILSRRLDHVLEPCVRRVSASWTVSSTWWRAAEIQHGPRMFGGVRPGVSRRVLGWRMRACRCSPRAAARDSRSSRLSCSSRRMRSVAASSRRSSEASEARWRCGTVGVDAAGWRRWRSRWISARMSGWV
jgi:Transposase DDE domain group 1